MSLHKKWSFPLNISSVDIFPNSQKTADLVTVTEEILNGKLHFLCSVCSFKELHNSANDLSHFYLSLIPLRKDTGRHHVFKKDINKCFWRICLQLVFSQGTIREVQGWNMVLGVKISLIVTKLDYRWSLITSI